MGTPAQIHEAVLLLLQPLPPGLAPGKQRASNLLQPKKNQSKGKREKEGLADVVVVRMSPASEAAVARWLPRDPAQALPRR